MSQSGILEITSQGGSRVRNNVKLADGKPKGSRTPFTMDCALEIDGNEKPAQAVWSGAWPWDRCDR
jgi:hypothetical protein